MHKENRQEYPTQDTEWDPFLVMLMPVLLLMANPPIGQIHHQLDEMDVLSEGCSYHWSNGLSLKNVMRDTHPDYVRYGKRARIWFAPGRYYAMTVQEIGATAAEHTEQLRNYNRYVLGIPEESVGSEI